MYTVKVHETIIKPHQLPLKRMVHGILPQLDDQKKEPGRVGVALSSGPAPPRGWSTSQGRDTGHD